MRIKIIKKDKTEEVFKFGAHPAFNAALSKINKAFKEEKKMVSVLDKEILIKNIHGIEIELKSIFGT